MTKRGAPPIASDEAQRERASCEDRICQEYRKTLFQGWSGIAKARALNAARGVRGSTSKLQLQQLRALYYAITTEENPFRTNYRSLVEVAQACLPTNGTLSERTIADFVFKGGLSPHGGTTPHVDTVLDLLFLASILRAKKHPAIMHFMVAHALAYSLSALDAFGKSEPSKPEFDRTLQTIAMLAQELYDAVALPSFPMGAEHFDNLAETVFFNGIAPASTPDEMASRVMGFVRLGTEDNEYILGRSTFTRIDIPEDSGEPRKSYFYIETFVDGGQNVSSGFVVVRKRGDVYLIQQHRDAAGFNITTIASEEILDMQSGFSRGLLLTYGKVGFTGGMASRVAMFPISSTAQPTRVEGLAQLRESIKEIAPEVHLQELERFLHSEKRISIRAPIIGTKGEEKEIFENWGQIVAFCQSIIDDGPNIDDKKIEQFITAPLRAKWVG